MAVALAATGLDDKRRLARPELYGNEGNATRRQSGVLRFAPANEPFVEGPQRRVQAGGRLRGKKEHGARCTTATPDGAAASLRATLAGKRREASQGRAAFDGCAVTVIVPPSSARSIAGP